MGQKKYKVAQAGLGYRGEMHVRSLLANDDRYELAAVCDINADRLSAIAGKYKIANTYADADAMLAAVKPDVFVFVTNPDVRVSMVRLAVKHGIKAMAFEKPMATTVKEAAEIARLCADNNIKAVVSHQQKYLTSMVKLKQIVDSGALGKINQINISTQGWLYQLGTHYMDLALWLNGFNKAKWVVGHAHGAEKLTDSHPSPDYIMGQVAFENGVRVFSENGYLSKSYVDTDVFWFDNRITVYGELGYAWGETNAAWGMCANGKTESGQGAIWPEQEFDMQVAYFKEFVKWLDEDEYVHPCNVAAAYQGFEILGAMCLSATENKVVYLPVSAAAFPDTVERMKAVL